MTGRIAIVSPVVDTGAVPMDRVLADLDGGGRAISHRFLDGGPSSIESDAEAEQCVPWLVQAADAEVAGGGVAALIVNCMCDPGVAVLRARLSVPVVGPAEACMHLLAGLGLRFSVLDVVEEAREEVEAQVRRFGLAHAFASHRAIRVPVLDIYKDRARSAAALHAQAMAAVGQDGAQALLLGCTGFSDLAGDLRALMAGGPEVAVIEPLQTAVTLAGIVAAARPGSGR